MEISLEAMLRVLGKCWIIIIVLAIVFALCGYFGSEYLIQKTYVATAKLNIIAKTEADSKTTTSYSADSTGLSYASKLVKTCSEILTTKDFKTRVISDAGIDETPSISTTFSEDTTIITITVSTHDPDTCIKAAMAAAEAANEYIGEKTDTKASIVTIDNPVRPDSPDSPNPRRNALIAGLIAAVLTYAIYLFVEILGTKVKDEVELSNRYDLPVIACIPDFNETTKHKGSYYEAYVSSKGGKK